MYLQPQLPYVVKPAPVSMNHFIAACGIQVLGAEGLQGIYFGRLGRTLLIKP